MTPRISLTKSTMNMAFPTFGRRAKKLLRRSTARVGAVPMAMGARVEGESILARVPMKKPGSAAAAILQEIARQQGLGSTSTLSTHGDDEGGAGLTVAQAA